MECFPFPEVVVCVSPGLLVNLSTNRANIAVIPVVIADWLDIVLKMPCYFCPGVNDEFIRFIPVEYLKILDLFSFREQLQGFANGQAPLESSLSNLCNEVQFPSG